MVTLANLVHPGEVPKEEFLDEMVLAACKVGKAAFESRIRIEPSVKCERGVAADTATRLSCFFGTSAEHWLNLQAATILRMRSKMKRCGTN